MRLVSKSQTLVAAIICAREIRPTCSLQFPKLHNFSTASTSILTVLSFETPVHFSYSLLCKAELKEITMHITSMYLPNEDEAFNLNSFLRMSQLSIAVCKRRGAY